MVGSPGRITFDEIAEVLFGYLVFAGLDKIFALIGSFWAPGDEKKKEQVKVILQLAGIILALIILFRHKFFT